MLGFSAVGFGGMLTGRSATLVVVPITPLAATVLLSAGALLLAWRFVRPVAHEITPAASEAVHRDLATIPVEVAAG